MPGFLVIILFLTDWVIRIVALMVVPRQRQPSSALAWLFVIMTVPFIGGLLFLVIGSMKLNKNRRESQKKIDSILKKIIRTNDAKKLMPTVSNEYQHLFNLNKKLGSFPAFYAGDTTFLPDYNSAIEDIISSIHKAEDFVHIQYYILALDDTTEPLFEALKTARERGVVVRVLFDSIGSRSYPRFGEMKNKLSEYRIKWHEMLPLKMPGKNFNRPDLRNHRKIVVIDNVTAYMGSQNMVDKHYHRKDSMYYYELVARVSGPVVLQLQAVFLTDWYSESGKLLQIGKAPQYSSGSLSHANISQVLPSGPSYDNENNAIFFTEAIYTARDNVTIVNPYLIPDEPLMRAITTAATKGVAVSIINSKDMDKVSTGNAQRSFYEELLSAGVKIYQYKGPALLHTKTMTIDDKLSIVGSSNLDVRSLALNFEVNLFTYSKESAAALSKIHNSYISNSHNLSLVEWRSRPITTKLLESVSRLTANLQ